MALNFGLLDQGGPTNFFEGYSQGQEKMQANAMAQQRAAQAQQEFGMRQQEFAAGQAEKKRASDTARVTQKLASFKDALLRAPNAKAAGRIVQLQYDDSDLGPIRRQFGSLQDALAEIPEETTAFQKYIEDEAMGMEEARKQRASDRAFNIAMGRVPQTNAMGGAPAAPAPAPAALTAAVAPAPVPAQPNVGVGTTGVPGVGMELPFADSFATRLNPTTGEIEPVPLRENQAAAGLFDKLNQTYSPVFGTLVLTAPEIVTRLNNKLTALTNNPPEDMTPQMRAQMIAAVKEEIIAATERVRLTPTNAMAPQAPAAAVTNAMAPAPAAPLSELQGLIDRRDSLSAIFNQTPRVKTNIENLNKDIERLSRTKEKINVIGVAKGTGNPVYLDSISDEQYVYVADADGKQKRKLYSGPVDRSTSNVTATANARLPPLESAERKGKGELNVSLYKVISDAARLATKTLPALETQAKILDSGFKTGFGTETQKAAASLLSALGVPEATKFATDAQTFLAATQQAVLQKQLEQKGPQTESDAKRITDTGAQLGNTVEANRFIVDVAKAQFKRDLNQRGFFDKWWAKNETYEGAEDAWFNGEGGKSLFDAPELTKYVASKRSEADAILKGK